MIKVSSTYWIIGKSVEKDRGIGRCSSPKFLSLLRIDQSKSAARTKRRG
jgi:hypothetical protein